MLRNTPANAPEQSHPARHTATHLDRRPVVAALKGTSQVLLEENLLRVLLARIFKLLVSRGRFKSLICLDHT